MPSHEGWFLPALIQPWKRNVEDRVDGKNSGWTRSDRDAPETLKTGKLVVARDIDAECDIPGTLGTNINIRDSKPSADPAISVRFIAFFASSLVLEWITAADVWTWEIIEDRFLRRDVWNSSPSLRLDRKRTRSTTMFSMRQGPKYNVLAGKATSLFILVGMLCP